MNENLNYSATDGIWHGELLDSSLCQKCLRLHDHHACTPLSKPFLGDSADALSLPPRSIKSRITGALSLHDYHKFLSKSANRSGDPVDHTGKKLKRKTAALHLNRSSPLSISYPVSVSSVASSPPPLSPSYSHSIVSQRSEEPEIGEAQTVQYQSTQSPRLPVVSDLGSRARPNRKRVNTFREKLQQRARAQAEEAERASKPQTSDSMLASTQAVATVSHGGTCFEILNPRKSLDLARIVSYIEDVDNCSTVSTDNQRDSSFSIEQGLDRVSLSQFTDASLPSFYSTNSLYTSLPDEPSTPKGQPTDIPSSSPRIGERVRSLSDYSLNEQTFNFWSRPAQRTGNNDLRIDTHNDHPSIDRETPQSPQMASITEESNPPNLDFSRRPSTPSTQTFYSESEIGEPGSPVYANGDWAQVDERDRGILFDLQEDETTDQHHHPDHQYYPYSQEQEPPTPRETPLETPSGSPMYPTFDSAYPYPSSISTSKLPYSAPFDPHTYDPVYFDPHVQSVLAAANAETMGLRGSPARALDELQRGARSGETSPRFEFQRRKSDDRKSGAQRKGLRKFFSWKS
ncbi:hypothetical protein PENNAL_c0001G03899 [Penicillium nalgiovense]|uniref:Uncharacterized protein n=1 Tax=Penicillium nalgiovense TaxID=60175 RepID=A0A1V6Z9K0_PENNA|nr:hypothetical protein PENNAL_c0001G03899 [Penicillium nalgiovense]CAG8213157.1 unnamed protein product [Penicillium nalgiovense]